MYVSYGRPEICKLEASLAINQQILGLKIAVEYAVAVAVRNTLDQLVEV